MSFSNKNYIVSISDYYFGLMETNQLKIAFIFKIMIFFFFPQNGTGWSFYRIIELNFMKMYIK